MAWTIQQRRTIRSTPRRKPDVWALPFANEPRAADMADADEPDGDPQPWTDADAELVSAPSAPEPVVEHRPVARPRS